MGGLIHWQDERCGGDCRQTWTSAFVSLATQVITSTTHVHISPDRLAQRRATIVRRQVVHITPFSIDIPSFLHNHPFHQQTITLIQVTNSLKLLFRHDATPLRRGDDRSCSVHHPSIHLFRRSELSTTQFDPLPQDTAPISKRIQSNSENRSATESESDFVGTRVAQRTVRESGVDGMKGRHGVSDES
ncbi:hypothetical protein BLNAU_8410 [Blattamonas nauphoetae]|uniref:Uncharacterized protein n=1 Tax=Blattamonas nauphoetae TaxID=2049346 RepID=A0ABQ9XYJ4_9EUKA|nr:hypothetical protein BLNAU_8410 [Blattamonas nauphoetae]